MEGNVAGESNFLIDGRLRMADISTGQFTLKSANGHPPSAIVVGLSKKKTHENHESMVFLGIIIYSVA